MTEPIKPGDMVMVVTPPTRLPEMLGAVGTVLDTHPPLPFPPSTRTAPACRVRFPTEFVNLNGRPVPTGWLKTTRLQKLRPPAPPPKAVPTTSPILEGVPA